ncbi:D-arabinono-1,4-lactone oxidase family protein [Striga asiatica]|uniref:D-arabinono-1,4-lactone oxidase family protein n=1 Tax=Striga asiatica TaxID=4170 RepID=A0A5A7QZT6_STRAF|nr:D-arabinono-1,4-lactone oxidase family protein [Striga asiatica]
MTRGPLSAVDSTVDLHRSSASWIISWIWASVIQYSLSRRFEQGKSSDLWSQGKVGSEIVSEPRVVSPAPESLGFRMKFVRIWNWNKQRPSRETRRFVFTRPSSISI